MLFTPRVSNSFANIESSKGTTRINSAQGTLITLDSFPTKGSWVQVVASTAYDSYGLLVNINTGFIDSTLGGPLLDIGVGSAGSEVVLIPDVYFGGPGPYVSTEGHWLYYPIFIKAGTRVSIRGYRTSGTGNCYAYLQFKEQPRTSFSVNTACEYIGGATPVVSGTTSEGAWYSCGTLTKKYNTFVLCIIHQIAALNNLGYHIDLAVGDGTNKHTIQQDLLYITNTAEHQTYISNMDLLVNGASSGDTLYVRSQCSGTPQNFNIYIHGLY